MALIGVSGEPAVANHVADASFVAASLDATLAAFIAQLGGVSWSAGVPSRVNGKLQAINFVASGLGLRNANFDEPRAMLAIGSSRSGLTHATTDDVANLLSHLFSRPAEVFDINVVVKAIAGTTDTPWTFRAYINGNIAGTCSVTASNGTTSSGIIDLGGFLVAAGDLLVVSAQYSDTGDTTTLSDATCHINLKHGLVGANDVELT